MVELSIQQTDPVAAEAVEITRPRSAGFAMVIAGAVVAGVGAWMMLTAGPGHDRVASTALLVAGVMIAACGALAAARPGRLVVSGDGLYLTALFADHAVAWEEIVAIGRRTAASHLEPPGGVRIALIDRAPIDLASDWSISPDALVSLLTEARAQFSELPMAAPTEASAEEPISLASTAPPIVETA